MDATTYRRITDVAETEIGANMRLAGRSTSDKERYGFERQAVGAFQFWQQVTRGTKSSEDENRLAGYLSGPPMPTAGE